MDRISFPDQPRNRRLLLPVVGGIPIWLQLSDFRHRCLATTSHRVARSTAATTDRHSSLKLTVRDSVRDGRQSSRARLHAVKSRPGGRNIRLIETADGEALQPASKLADPVARSPPASSRPLRLR
jgi:hypothetical protein